MRCNGDFIDDRVCDMCSLVNNYKYITCKQEYEEKEALKRKLEEIKQKCPYKKQCLDEYEWFDACNKNGDAYGRFAPDCNVTLDCEII